MEEAGAHKPFALEPEVQPQTQRGVGGHRGVFHLGHPAFGLLFSGLGRGPRLLPFQVKGVQGIALDELVKVLGQMVGGVSGKGTLLPKPPPLRTVHESFPSHGSSLSKSSCPFGGAGYLTVHFWVWTCL
jgi:hypothetical protein